MPKWRNFSWAHHEPLLETHVALWAITDPPSLSTTARELILSPRATVWISVASIWEISIKHSLGRGEMPISGDDAIRYFRAAGYQFLAIEPEHAAAIEALPKHHQDPFDRLLVAQTLIEPMPLLTHDSTLARYSDSIVLV
jgi:PIN domain nuclease of toxin-antitoxin system